MNRLLIASIVLCLSVATPAPAQQVQEFGDYTVHYNALSTSQLSPQVAQSYGIQRSSNRAMLNITVLQDQGSGVSEAVPAHVEASARNLTGQYREIGIRELRESEDAIYYIGEFRVNHMETFDFTVKVVPEGSEGAFTVRFRQQFYTE